MDQEIDGTDDLTSDRAHRKVGVRHQDHVFNARERVAGGICVDRRHRAAVTGVHRLHHVECLAAPDLTDDDAVGSHSKAVSHQIPLGDLTVALDVRRARFELNHMRLLKLQLDGVLDRDDALARVDQPG